MINRLSLLNGFSSADMDPLFSTTPFTSDGKMDFDSVRDWMNNNISPIGNIIKPTVDV